MMKNPGYVYILINPSAKGLVKIGRTTKDPEERAKELSSATGVPTPFIVVYKAFFRDCSTAETFIHALLNEKRLMDNKEFFRVSPSDAVQAVFQAEKLFNQDSGKSGGGSEEKTEAPIAENSDINSEICDEIIEAADAHYYGWHDDILQDYEKALELYKQAAKLGCNHAYHKIGEMFYNGEGVKQDTKQALFYYQEGASKGDDKCWGNMAICYHEMKEYSNSDKCWVKLFTSPSMKGREGELGYYFYSFYKYMDAVRWPKHPDHLEAFYQKLKKGMEK